MAYRLLLLEGQQLVTKTCAECNWFHPQEAPLSGNLCRAHTRIGESTGMVLYGFVEPDYVSCHKFREGEKKNQIVADNWERGGSWHAHSQDH